VPVFVGVPRQHCFHEESCTVMKLLAYSFVSYEIHSTASDTTGNIQMCVLPSYRFMHQ